MQATYAVTPGDVLHILVGGKGGDGAPDGDVTGNDIHKSAASGGGGTFVSKGTIGTGKLLLVAGGGGGAGDQGGGGVSNNTSGNGGGSIGAGGGSFSADGGVSTIDNNCGKGGKAAINGGEGGANTCFKPSSNGGGYGGGACTYVVPFSYNTLTSSVSKTDALALALQQNRPNPFSQETTIAFTLSETNKADLTVYDITGRQVFMLNNDFKTGYNEVILNKSVFPTTGTYFYRLTTDKYAAVKQLQFVAE